MRSRGQRLWSQKPEVGHVAGQHGVFFFSFGNKEIDLAIWCFLEFF